MNALSATLSSCSDLRRSSMHRALPSDASMLLPPSSPWTAGGAAEDGAGAAGAGAGAGAGDSCFSCSSSHDCEQQGRSFSPGGKSRAPPLASSSDSPLLVAASSPRLPASPQPGGGSDCEHRMRFGS
eukprot:753357-Hanusia_phi.AAC.3